MANVGVYLMWGVIKLGVCLMGGNTLHAGGIWNRVVRGNTLHAGGYGTEW